MTAVLKYVHNIIISIFKVIFSSNMDTRFRFYHFNILEPHFIKLHVNISNYQEIKFSLLNEKKILIIIYYLHLKIKINYIRTNYFRVASYYVYLLPLWLYQNINTTRHETFF